MGIVLPFTNKYGAIIGMCVGHFTTIWICAGAFFLKHKTPTLSFSTDDCSDEIWEKVNQTSVAMRANATRHFVFEEVPWPQKIYTVSFLLYPLIGCTVTIVVGSIVSILTGYKRFSPDQDKYIHPLLVSIFRRFRSEKEYDLKHSNGIALKSIVKDKHVSNGDKQHSSSSATNGSYLQNSQAYLSSPESSNGAQNGVNHRTNGHSNNGFSID